MENEPHLVPIRTMIRLPTFRNAMRCTHAYIADVSGTRQTICHPKSYVMQMDLNAAELRRIELNELVATTVKQIYVLNASLEENERSWEMFGFANVPNPVADSLRRDIQKREALLARSMRELGGAPREQKLVRAKRIHAGPALAAKL